MATKDSELVTTSQLKKNFAKSILETIAIVGMKQWWSIGKICFQFVNS